MGQTECTDPAQTLQNALKQLQAAGDDLLESHGMHRDCCCSSVSSHAGNWQDTCASLQPSMQSSSCQHDQPLLHAEKEIYRCKFPLLIPSCSFGHSIAQLLACRMLVLCIDKRNVAVQAATGKESCGVVQLKQLNLGGSVWCSCRTSCRTQRPHLRAWTCSGTNIYCAAWQSCLLQPGFIGIVQKNAA